MRTLGDGDARRDDVAVHGAAVADFHLVRGRDVARHLAEDNQGLGEHLRLDFAIRANREDIVLQLDLALDLPFDGQILAPAQLTLDNDGLSNIHCVPPGLRPGRRLRCPWQAALGWLSTGRHVARWLHPFITFPHRSSPPSQGLSRPKSDRRVAKTSA